MCFNLLAEEHRALLFSESFRMDLGSLDMLRYRTFDALSAARLGLFDCCSATGIGM